MRAPDWTFTLGPNALSRPWPRSKLAFPAGGAGAVGQRPPRRDDAPVLGKGREMAEIDGPGGVERIVVGDVEADVAGRIDLVDHPVAVLVDGHGHAAVDLGRGDDLDRAGVHVGIAVVAVAVGAGETVVIAVLPRRRGARRHPAGAGVVVPRVDHQLVAALPSAAAAAAAAGRAPAGAPPLPLSAAPPTRPALHAERSATPPRKPRRVSVVRIASPFLWRPGSCAPLEPGSPRKKERPSQPIKSGVRIARCRTRGHPFRLKFMHL